MELQVLNVWSHLSDNCCVAHWRRSSPRCRSLLRGEQGRRLQIPKVREHFAVGQCSRSPASWNMRFGYVPPGNEQNQRSSTQNSRAM